MSELCRKCGGEKTGTHPRWCLACRRQARALPPVTVTPGNADGNGGNGPPVTTVTPGNAVTDGNAPVTPQHDPEACRVERERLEAEVAGLRATKRVAAAAEVEMLRGEVARLKRDLAAAHAKLADRPSRPLPAPAARAVVAPHRGKGEDETPTPHGPFCMCFACRQTRAQAALRGAPSC